VTGEVATRLESMRHAIASAVSRSRYTDHVSLVAVTKTVVPVRIREAYQAGHRVFGENRVQEGVDKIKLLADEMPDSSWHFIGTLQRNKARSAVQAFSLIESVDSLTLARRVDDLSGALDRRLPVLLEVNVAGERSKSGFAVDDLWTAVPQLLALQHLEIRGLMTVAPLVSEPEEVRPVFRRLRQIRDEAQDRLAAPYVCELSMGMTGDFEVAIEEGATMVRLGRAIFGERPV
jgi:PLP dependent protein